jgi:DNA end-binding protein Ku
MLFADELIDPGDLDELPDEDVRATDREVDMARQLIESLATGFDPSKYRDEYRERVLELIERKASGEEIAIPAEPEEPVAVPDLMAALEASLAAAKGGKQKLEAAGANGAKKNGASRKAPAKKAPAKKAPAKKAPAKSGTTKKPRAKSRA